mgnify:CR=1 FL=1
MIPPYVYRLLNFIKKENDPEAVALSLAKTIDVIVSNKYRDRPELAVFCLSKLKQHLEEIIGSYSP